MRKTLKKSFAILIVVVMLLGTIPFTSVAATTQVANLSQLQSALAGAASGDVIDVTSNISLTSALTVSNRVTIKSSNGSSLVRSSSYANYMIVVANGGELTLEDITINGNRTSTQTADLAKEMIVVQTGGTLNFNDGTLLTTNRGNALNNGGGITVAGTLNMNGGTITNIHMHNSSNATVQYGAAITVNGGTVNMYGGLIGGSSPDDSANRNDGRNGAIGVVNGTFNMYGGTISGNVANQQGGGAGGVHISANGTFNMYDGSVSNNNTRRNGGGFYNQGTLNIEGGIISGNTATYTDKDKDPSLFFGAAIYNTGTLTISGGEISGNVAKSCGGGVYNLGTMTMTGGTITDNASQQFSAGGIFVDGTGTLNLAGGEISNNSAGQYGGAIASTSTASNALVITDCIFNGNTCGSAQCGSDIYITKANTSNVRTSYDYECLHFQLYVDNTGARYSATNAVPATSNVLTAGYGYVYVQSGEGHAWGEWTPVSAATCTEQGVSQRVCPNCGKVETQTTPALGHSWNNGVQTVAPGCTTTGTMKYTCTRCGATRNETIAALGHDQSNATRIEPTCTTAGSISYTCPRCHQMFSETLPALGHNPVTTRVNPTCTTAGSLTTRCSRCNELISSSVLPATGHTPGEWEVVTPATKTSTGLKVIKCTVCGATIQSEIIPVIPDATVVAGTVELASVPAKLVKVPVTFVGNEGVWSMGFYAVYDAELTLKGVLVGDVFEDIVASPYDVDPATDARANAALTAAGISTSDYKVYRFYAENYLFENYTNDGLLCELVFNVPDTTEYELPVKILPIDGLTINIDSEDVSLLKTDGAIIIPSNNNCDHSSFTWTVTTPATCTTAGVREKICNLCGRTLATEPIPAPGHSYGAWTVSTPATCTTAGEETSVCSVCGATSYRTIPAPGHVPGEWVVTVEPGYQAGERVKYCTVCGAVVATEVLPPIYTPTIASSSEEAEGNQSVNATVSFNNNPGVCSMTLYIYYDEALTLNSVTNGNIFLAAELSASTTQEFLRMNPNFRASSVSAFNTRGVDMAGKKMTIVLLDSDDLVNDNTASGVLLNLNFTTPDVVEGVYEYGVVSNVSDIFNNADENVPVEITQGEIIVRESVCDHVWSAWTTVDAATCTVGGTEQRTCSVCGKVETRATAPLGHNVVNPVTRPASCTEAGFEGGTCSVCGEEIGTVIPALGHDWGEWTQVDDTTLRRVCARCGEVQTREISADPTLTVIGKTVREGETFTVPFMVSGNPGFETALMFVYFDEALHLESVAAGDVFASSEITTSDNLNRIPADSALASAAFTYWNIDPTGMRFVSLLFDSNSYADVSDNGTLALLTFTAPEEEGTYFIGALDSQPDVLNHVDDEVVFGFENSEIIVSACDHIAGNIENVPATCTEAGYIRTYCSICGNVIDETILPAKGHTLGEWEVTVAPTTETSGHKVQRCTVCGEILYEKDILPLGSPVIKVVETTAYVGEEFTVDVVLENNPGVWGLHPYLTYGPEMSVKRIQFSNEVFDECDRGTLNADPAANEYIAEAFAQAGESTAGVRTTSVTVCNSEIEDVHDDGNLFTATFRGLPAGDYRVYIVHSPYESFTADDVLVPMNVEDAIIHVIERPTCEHANTTTETVDATCTAAGYTRVICTDCGTIISNVVTPALGHNYTLTSETPATCTEAGQRVETCSRCGDVKTTTLPALGHLWGEWVQIDDDTLQRTCSRCGDIETKPVPQEPTLSVDGATAEPGETVTVDLKIANNPGFETGLIFVYFDKELTLNSVAAGDVFTASELTTSDSLNRVPADSPLASAAFTYWNIDPTDMRFVSLVFDNTLMADKTGDGVLATFTFTAPAEAGTYFVGVMDSQPDVLNHADDEVVFAFENSEIIVAAHEHVWGDWIEVTPARPGVAGLEKRVCQICGEEETRPIDPLPEYNLGDVNGDGKVNAKDLKLLKSYIEDEAEDEDIVFANSDIDGNGNVNIRDYKYLKSYIEDEIEYEELLEIHGD